MRLLLLVVAGALVLAAPAAGGGWATAGLAPPADGISAGDTWNAVVTIKQHGITPLDGVTPAVVISNGGTTKRFDAAPTGKPGVYVAKVKFPNDGAWRYQVWDGFSEYGGARMHNFAPVQVGPGGGGGLGVPEWTWGLVFAGLSLAALVLLARRTRPSRSAVAQP